MSCRFAFYTAPGARERNEDTALALEQDGRYLFLAADGLGGHRGGEIAAALAAGELRRRFLSGDFDLEEAVLAANRAIGEKQRETRLAMKSTVAAAYVSEEETVLCHVGDSRFYLFRAGRIVAQSRDHSAAQMAVALGEITPAQLRDHADRHILTRALGMGEDLRAETLRVSNRDYEALLLCSDGFWAWVSEPELEKTLQASAGAEEWLAALRACHARQAPLDCDNHTALAVTRERR